MSPGDGPHLGRVDASRIAAGARWCTRVSDALGDVLDGGHLMDVAHVGPTAVPGLTATPTVDLLARAYPWPLPADADARLADLGFERREEHDASGRTVYSTALDDVHLHVVGHENDCWHRQLALRDHLRTSGEARAAYHGATADGLASLEADALVRAIERTGFGPVVEVARALADAPARWAIAGGWALDAVAAAPSRHHDDVDVAVDAAASPAVLDTLTRHGARCARVIAGTPARYLPRALGEAHPGGGHQAHARWGETWMHVVIEPWSDAAWHYRRDPTITLPLDRAVRRVSIGDADVPVMAPEAVLLFKATTGGRRTPRPKDDADLPQALRTLDDRARSWLHAALPAEHPWRERLVSG